MSMKRFDIQKDLRRRIESGEWPYGTRIPSLDQLASEYNAARGTVRTATNQLAALGLLVAAPGRGIKVIAAPATHSHLGTFPPADWGLAKDYWGSDTGQEVTTNNQLRQTETDGVQYVERDYTRTADGIPVQHKRTRMALEYASIVPDGCTSPPMLTPTGGKVPEPPPGVSPNEWYGWGITDIYTDVTLESVAPDVAGALGIPEATPVLQQHSKACKADGTVVYTTTVTMAANGRMTLHQRSKS